MERKFLVFSCVVLLISIFYFIFTTVKDQSLTKNQQEPSKELDETSFKELDETSFSTGNLVKPSTSGDSSPSHQKSSDSEPTAEEWQAFDQALQGSLEGSGEREEKGQSSSASEAETPTSEAENSGMGINPGIEKMFIKHKEIVDRRRQIWREISPLSKRHAELNDRISELSDLKLEMDNRGEDTTELTREYLRAYDEVAEISATLKPLEERRAQIEKEWEEYLQTHYGMSNEQFRETYAAAFRSWMENQ